MGAAPLVTSFTIVAPFLSAAPLCADELVVPADYATIQAAIDAAEAGDTVTVEPGSYSENLVLGDDLVIRGRETARVLLRPADDSEPAVLIENATSVMLSNMTLIDAEIAIAVQNSADVTLANNVFIGAQNAALSTDQISDVEAVNNVFFENAVAVRRASDDTELTNTIFAGNTITVTGLGGIVDNDIAVRFSCLFDNDDVSEGDGDVALGTNFQIGDPLFVDTNARDFHLREDSPCIDAGSGTDAIDGTVADMGAYGGGQADVLPFPVAAPAIENLSGAAGPFRLQVSWSPNLAYLVTNSANPGGYRLHYRPNRPGPPYDGVDAGNGTLPSPIDVGNVTAFVLEDLEASVEPPAAPTLLAAEPRNNAVALRWSEVPGATRYRIGFGVDGANERQADAQSTTHTVTGLENGVAYRFTITALAQAGYFVAITAIDNTQARHESALSDPGSIPLGPVQASPASNELVATPQVTVPVPDLPNEGCFIATAAFGADWAAEVQILRDFRDRYLLASPPGRVLVQAYYGASPYAARTLERHPGAKPLVRAALAPAVGIALFMLAAGPAAKLGVLLLGLALGVGAPRTSARFASGSGA